MSQGPLFTELKSQLEKTRQIVNDSPWEDREFYAAWLAQTYYYCRHTTRLLAYAGSLTPIDNQEFHNRFLKHAAEEKGHEKLPLLDLKQLGNYDIKDLPELAATQSLYQTQYYWIQHVSPMAFYGFILALECLATTAGPAVTKKIEDIHGPNSARFLSVHAEEDIEHVEEAIKKVEKLSAQVQQIVYDNMIQCFENYNNLVISCKTDRGQKSWRAAA